jgi:predicted ABC-type ATPase
MFAGPNGSGKSTIYHQIKEKYNLGIYLNADDLEKELSIDKCIELSRFGFNDIKKNELIDYINVHPLTKKATSECFNINFELSENKIISSEKESNSYSAALLVDFIRQKLLSEGKTISFETVMSHSSKIDILKQSLSLGYKNYLYFICTDSVKINLERVSLRVQMGGHPVKEDKIKERYYNSLSLLKSAVESSYRSFIFDNSEDEPKLILEVFNGEEVTYHNYAVPNWVDKYLLNI